MFRRAPGAIVGRVIHRFSRCLAVVLLPVSLSACGKARFETAHAEDNASGEGGGAQDAGTNARGGADDGLMSRSSRAYVVDDSTFGACVQLVSARCERVRECEGRAASSIDCLRAAIARCPEEVFADGGNFTMEMAKDCAKDWESFDCESLRNFDVPACANIAGELPDGEACYSSAQCKNGCSPLLDTACGVCAPYVSSDSACSVGADTCPGYSICLRGACLALVGEPSCDGGCSADQVCFEEHCVVPPSPGEPCAQEGQAPYSWGVCPGGELRCVAGICRSSDDFPKEGAPCLVESNVTGLLEYCAPGLICDDDTCQMAKLGGPCLGQYDECGDELICDDDVCVERIRYRQQGCSDINTQCDPGLECRDNVCLGPRKSTPNLDLCAN